MIKANQAYIMKKDEEIRLRYSPSMFVQTIHELMIKENKELYTGMDIMRSTFDPIYVPMLFLLSIIISYNRESMETIIEGTTHSGMVNIKQKDILNACEIHRNQESVDKIMMDVVGKDIINRTRALSAKEMVESVSFAIGGAWPSGQFTLMQTAFIYYIMRDLITNERRITKQGAQNGSTSQEASNVE